jgi:tetratricopeptide (TPR) repeat protein
VQPLAPSALPVAVHGCAGLTLAPACWRSPDPAPLVLWIEGEQPADAITVLVDDMPASTDDALDVDAGVDGVRIAIDPPAAAERLELVHVDGRSFALELVPEPPAWLAAQAELEAMLSAERPLREVRARLVELRAALGPVEAHRLDCFELELAFQAGDWASVVHGPWRLHRSHSTATDVACVDLGHVRAVYATFMRAPDHAQAHSHLEAAGAHPQHLQATINVDYLTGELERRLGRLDESLAWFERAARIARRLGLHEYHASAVIQHATALAALGRFEEAKALADEAEAALPPDDPLRPEIRSNAAWVQILRREDEPSLPDPSPTLRELAAHYERTGEEGRANGVRLNLAIVASQSHDFAAAERALASIDRSELADTAEQVFWELVTARIAEQRRDTADAREHLERARLLAELGSDDELQLRARLARAGLELTLGNTRQARHELEQAEHVEDRIALGISPSEGRSTFSSARRHDRARHVELLLALGERDAALCTVLGARARPMRSLAAQASRPDPALRRRQDELLVRHLELRTALAERTRESWDLPADELLALRQRSDRELEALDALLAEAMTLGEHEPPTWRCDDVRSAAPAEGLATMHPATTPGRWWWFFDRAAAIEVVEVELEGASPDDAAAAERGATRALERLAAAGRLAGLRMLTVVPLGVFATVDLHALTPVQDLEVQYSVGLGRPDRVVTAAPSVGVLVGASANLREPRAEAATVGEAMRDAGWSVIDPWAPTTGPQPTLLHYAGHGHHGGTTGWDSYLVLADGELRPKQIIAHGRSPAIVVLGACDAGTSDPGVIDGGMNMATAFVLAGAALVIAPQRSVDDHDARALAELLYADLPRPGDPARMAELLRARLATAQRREPRFRQWRAWVP